MSVENRPAWPWVKAVLLHAEFEPTRVNARCTDAACGDIVLFSDEILVTEQVYPDSAKLYTYAFRCPNDGKIVSKHLPYHQYDILISTRIYHQCLKLPALPDIHVPPLNEHDAVNLRAELDKLPTHEV